MLRLCFSIYGTIIIMVKWYQKPVAEVMKELQSGPQGLSAEEAKIRLKHDGYNELPKQPPIPGLKIFLNQFRSAIILILVSASMISFGLGDFIDAWVIAAAVIINVIVGWLQEFRAERSLEQLRSAVAFNAVVIRDGKEFQIPAREVAVGDIMLLRSGDRIPADARLIEVDSFTVNEAALTGEPYPIDKQAREVTDDVNLGDRKDMVFVGTTVSSGTATAIVVATGLKSEIGRVAELVRTTKEEPTPLQHQLQKLGVSLSYIILSICIVIFAIGVLANRDVVEMFTTAVAVAVAAVPEGMVIGITVILTIGMQRMLRQRALTRKLVAAETLGSTSIICTDKTGTLTEGEMHVAGVVASEGEYATDQLTTDEHYGEELLMILKIGILCNDAFVENEDAPLKNWKVVGNPTERALLVAGDKLGLRKTKEEKEMPRVDTIGFNSDRKYMLTLHKLPNKKHLRVLAKGAPERILASADRILTKGDAKHLTDERRKHLEQEFNRLSSTGLRLLALAYTDVSEKVRSFEDITVAETKFVFAGFVFIKDPLRAGAADTVKQVRQAGVKVAMITGDHANTARAIATELGLPHEPQNIIDGAELAQLSEHDLTRRVKDITVYARVSPEDKLRIVDALQARGEVVAMTGDGVNDAPALRSADIGVALGSGTAVAKETAAMVLLDNNFKTIVAAVREGRVMFDNMRKLITYLLSDSFTQVIVIGASLIIGLWVEDFPLPLAAAQILWINLITDGFPHIALTVEPGEKENMREKPRKKDEPIISREMRTLIAVVSSIMAVITLSLFWYYWHSTGDVDRARSVAFAALGIDTLLFAFSVKSLRYSILSKQTFNNPWLIAAIGLGLVMQIMALHLPPLQRVFQVVPLTLNEWLLVLGTGAVVIMLIEIVKKIFVQRNESVHAYPHA